MVSNKEYLTGLLNAIFDELPVLKSNWRASNDYKN